MSNVSFSSGHAVVIGVGADLPATVTDANGMADILRDPARCAYPPSQVHVLTGARADRDGILAALDALAGATDAESTAVIYFSGHGERVTTTIGDAYFLLPYGYDTAALHTTAVSGTELVARLRAIPAQKVLLLLDCCHAGGLSAVNAPGLDAAKAPMPPDVHSK